ncbi:MAG TPA: ferric reductase-like transmembrane domain-containing protein [Solirubrobacteraceae bacterium]|jgi:sulfoxide reductase heme-binding subunit YedZ
MIGPAPAEYGWWLASRAAGLTALLCITVAVGVGLALGGKLASKRPGLPRALMAVHEHAALAGLIAIAVHGITLLGDGWLKPSIADVAVPFASDVKPFWVGLGTTGGWLAALLGLTFYARRRIGTKLWRKAHRATIVVYILSVAHTLGAGTDAQEPWLQAFLLATGAPILFLLLMRVLPRESPEVATAGSRRPSRT